MKKIQALRLEGLKLPEEMAYYYFVISAVAVYTVVADMFEKVFGRFKSAYDYQDELYQRTDRKRLSQEVQEKAAARDKWFRKLRSNIREVVEFGEGAKLEAAKILSAIVDDYGGAKIPTLTVEAETGVLLNLYDDLQKKFADKIELLNLTSVVEGAKQANDDFIEAQNRRTQSDANYGKGAMEDARQITARNYRYFIDSVNIEADEDGNGVLTPFIDYMNAKIDDMRKLAGQSPSSSTGTSSGSTGSEGDIRFKYATFEFANGESIKRRVEVGTLLVFPDNTAGYVWWPQLKDGLMPNRNIVFKEIPITSAEVIATFHFADHREEEIRQIVGTILHGPANTKGFYWQPAVPSTMPAEDTSYYEMPLEDNGGNNGSGSGGNGGSGSGENTGSGGNDNTGSGGGDNTGGSSNKFTVTYKYPETGEVITTQEYEVGEKIVPPTPPTGYVWGYYPDNMPDRNVFVDALPDVIDF